MLNKEVIKNSLLLTFKEITIMKLQQRNYKITKKLANSEQSDDFICIADHFSPVPGYVSIGNIQ